MVLSEKLQELSNAMKLLENQLVYEKDLNKAISIKKLINDIEKDVDFFICKLRNTIK